MVKGCYGRRVDNGSNGCAVESHSGVQRHKRVGLSFSQGGNICFFLIGLFLMGLFLFLCFSLQGEFAQTGFVQHDDARQQQRLPKAVDALLHPVHHS